jgi:murein L,D-transpeptidase YafK
MLARPALAAGVALALAFAVVPPPTAGAAGPTRVTRVLVRKEEHTLQLLSKPSPAGPEEIVRSYRVAIGPGGAGPKRREGDGVTPVGRYRITMHQPSQYRVFLRLDYPNAEDVARFARLKEGGALPATARIGGDIGLHGPPVRLAPDVRAALKASDWTLGCIALDDEEILEIARLVPDGTTVDIED